MSTHFKSYVANLHRVRMVEFIDHQLVLEERRSKRVAAENRANAAQMSRAGESPRTLPAASNIED